MRTTITAVTKTTTSILVVVAEVAAADFSPSSQGSWAAATRKITEKMSFPCSRAGAWAAMSGAAKSSR
jgi:hypothetical protein